MDLQFNFLVGFDFHETRIVVEGKTKLSPSDVIDDAISSLDKDLQDEIDCGAARIIQFIYQPVNFSENGTKTET